MTDTVRMKVTVTFEYDAVPEHYDGRGPVDMADMDRMNFEDDTGHLMNILSGSICNIKVEPIND